MKMLNLGLLTVALALAGCAGSGSSDSPAEERSAPEATSGQAPGSSTPARVLTPDYLEGAWCSREADRDEEISYAFYSDGTYRFGKQGEIVDGPGIDAFIRSITVVSREDDRFVVEQAGRELVFSRGDCVER